MDEKTANPAEPQRISLETLANFACPVVTTQRLWLGSNARFN